MTERPPRRWRALAAILMLLPLAACTRPTGDFGRAKRTYIPDIVTPALGKRAAEARGEPVSDFNWTDDERELRNRAWNFVKAPHVADWWLNSLAEGERTRLLPMLTGDGRPDAAVMATTPKWALPALGPAYDPTRYYHFLSAEYYRSSEARWVRMGDDITGDALLVPPFCEVAARVRRMDVERLGALARLPEEDPAFGQEAYDRVAENEATIAWVWRALRYRLTSYRFAIDRLQVETPTEKVWAANRAYVLLAAQKCEGAAPIATVARVARRSRLMDGPDPFDQPVLQK